MKFRKLFLIGMGVFWVGLIFCHIALADDSWPPKYGSIFPAVELMDQEGSKFKISDLKGKVILIEYVGMNCPACQAFSGANTDIGPYENNAVQSDLKSIEEYLPAYAGGINLSDERIVFIQVLLYDLQLNAPKPEDAQKWAEHFHFDKAQRQIVSVPTRDLRNDASFNLIPGFQLVDKNLVLRSDSTGHNPKENLWKTLLPLVQKLIEE